jgi:hypothetical protein
MDQGDILARLRGVIGATFCDHSKMV